MLESKHTSGELERTIAVVGDGLAAASDSGDSRHASASMPGRVFHGRVVVSEPCRRRDETKRQRQPCPKGEHRTQVPHTSGAQLQLDATDRATAQLIWKAGVGEEVPQLLPLGQGRPAVVWRRGNFTFEPAVVDAKTVKRHMRGMDGCMHM